MREETYVDIIRELVRRGKLKNNEAEKRLAKMSGVPVERAACMLKGQFPDFWVHKNWTWGGECHSFMSKYHKREWSKMTDLAREVDRVYRDLDMAAHDPLDKDIKETTATHLKKALPESLFKQDWKLWKELPTVAQETIIYRTLDRYFGEKY
tara:strand:- start:816 stop:1271 length:456 start_codon:yes stop_codon:yes gene_type:complete